MLDVVSMILNKNLKEPLFYSICLPIAMLAVRRVFTDYSIVKWAIEINQDFSKFKTWVLTMTDLVHKSQENRSVHECKDVVSTISNQRISTSNTKC